MNKEVYFNFSAGLRIHDAPDLHQEITEKTGLIPTSSHKKGDTKSYNPNQKWTNDIWSIKSQLEEKNNLTEHLTDLWRIIKPHKDYFNELIEKNVKMDIFCGYRSNCDHCGFDIDSGGFDIIRELKIPITFSVIIT